jgi:hypothetical protein
VRTGWRHRIEFPDETQVAVEAYDMSVMQIQAPTPLPPTIPMDPNLVINQLVPLIGSIAAMVMFALIARWLFKSPIGEAIAEGIRLRRRRRHGLTGEGADESRIQTLEEQIRQLSAHVSELGERLDFTERVLVEHRDRRIGTGK